MLDIATLTRADDRGRGITSDGERDPAVGAGQAVDLSFRQICTNAREQLDPMSTDAVQKGEIN